MGYYDGGELPYMTISLATTACATTGSAPFPERPGPTGCSRSPAVRSIARIKTPIYAERSFVRKLERTSPPVSWRWYSYFPGSLRMIDPKYRLSHHDHFAYVDRRAPELPPRQTLKGMLLGDGVDVGDLLLHEDECFLDQAKAGTLPQVSGSTPTSRNRPGTPPLKRRSPAVNIRAGQELVLMIYAR